MPYILIPLSLVQTILVDSLNTLHVLYLLCHDQLVIDVSIAAFIVDLYASTSLSSLCNADIDKSLVVLYSILWICETVIYLHACDTFILIFSICDAWAIY